MHHKNIQTLATEMFNVKYDMCPEITSNIFIEETKCHYNLPYRNFRNPPVKSVYHGTKSLQQLQSLFWWI